MADPQPIPPAASAWPVVTVQLPVYNERYVVERLIESVARLDYPRESLEIQVLDDSPMIRGNRRRQGPGAAGPGIFYFTAASSKPRGILKRALGSGFGSGPRGISGDFDADFLPPADFLRKRFPIFRTLWSGWSRRAGSSE